MHQRPILIIRINGMGSGAITTTRMVDATEDLMGEIVQVDEDAEVSNQK